MLTPRDQVIADLGRELTHIMQDAIGDGSWDVFLVREIEFGFDHGAGEFQAFGPAIVDRADMTGHLLQRKATLHFGFGVDEVGEAFDFNQIDSAVFEGPAREFTGFSKTGAGKCPEFVQHGGDNRLAAVDLQLDAIFACKGRRGGEKEDEASVQRLAIAPVQRAQSGFSWLRYRVDDLSTNIERRRPAETDDCHAGRKTAAG